jgi:hypothetical protein
VTSGTRPLRLLATEATAVALGSVARTESYDEDRLHVHRLDLERVLRGRIDDAEPGIVEIRGGGQRPPVLVPGERVIVLVRPAPTLSYLAQHLPAGAFLEVVAGRDGVVPVGSDREVEAVSRALADGAAIAALEGAAAKAAARRLAFSELGSGNPRLMADALAELRRLDELASPSHDEVETLGRVLRDREVDRAVRIGLIQLLTARRTIGAMPALTTAEADDPAVLGALLAARATLGSSGGRQELAPYLSSSDPAVRAAAVRALARLGNGAAVTELERYATVDPDPGVRVAAIEALGATKQPAAVPVLARTFDAEPASIMQASARAMLDIDGPAVDDALVGLALRGGTPTARRYAAAILMLSRGRNHPAVRRIEASNPPPEVRDLLEHGLQDPHHRHD